MKHFIFFLGWILYSAPVSAQFVGDSGNSGKKSTYTITAITSLRDFVTIQSMSLINNVHIIIRDNEGNVMYEDTITLLPTDNTIYVPEEYDNEKYSIDIYYKREHISEKLDESFYVE